MRPDVGVFVLSYGRTEVVPTVRALRRSNYTGRWWVIIGNDDPQLALYRARFGSRCIVFDKAAYVARTDRMGLPVTKAICFARNACYDIAAALGLAYFQQLDDDYTGFYMPFTDTLEFCNGVERTRIRNYDRLLTNMVAYLESLPPVCKAVAFGQGGDFIGGFDPETFWIFSRLRKAMNSWVCATERRIIFRGAMNEDVNAYTLLQHQGGLCLSTMQYRLQQPMTQSAGGGMAAIYRQYGTHVKSFLTVMLNPSCCKVGLISDAEQRLHHAINWARCAPKILRARHRKVV